MHCGQQITIRGRGKTVVATIQDRCPNPGCGYGDLDMSRGLFSQFASFDDGRFDISWDYGGEQQQHSMYSCGILLCPAIARGTDGRVRPMLDFSFLGE